MTVDKLSMASVRAGAATSHRLDLFISLIFLHDAACSKKTIVCLVVTAKLLNE